MNSSPTSISIRPAHRDDFVALWHVASLDSTTVPAEPLLVAEWDGRLVAALSLPSGAVVADPFVRTAAAVDMLRLRARQMTRPTTGPSHRLLSRLRGRPAPAAAQ